MLTAIKVVLVAHSVYVQVTLLAFSMRLCLCLFSLIQLTLTVCLPVGLQEEKLVIPAGMHQVIVTNFALAWYTAKFVYHIFSHAMQGCSNCKVTDKWETTAFLPGTQ